MLCDLPLELLNGIISYLDSSHRFNLRSTCKALEHAVARSDFYAKSQIIITTESVDLCAKFDESLRMDSCNFPNDYQFVRVRKRLFKRIFGEATMYLEKFDGQSISTLTCLLEGCILKSLKCHIWEFNEKVFALLASFKTANMDLHTHCFVVENRLLTELVRRGHSMNGVYVAATSSETIFAALKIVDSTRIPQELFVKVSDSLRYEFYALLGIRSEGNTLHIQREMEEVQIIRHASHSGTCNIVQYRDVEIREKGLSLVITNNSV